MDNQQDQFGAANPNNTGRTNQSPATTPGVAGASRSGASNAADNTASGSAPASRKPTNTPDAQNPSGALNQNNANADSNRQGEGQQANDKKVTCSIRPCKAEKSGLKIRVYSTA